MNDFWLRLKIWIKVAIFVVLAIFGIIFLLKNDGVQVNVWFIKPYTTTVLRLLFITFAFGVAVTLLTRTTIRTIRQISELKERTRAQRMERDLAQLRTAPTTAPIVDTSL